MKAAYGQGKCSLDAGEIHTVGASHHPAQGSGLSPGAGDVGKPGAWLEEGALCSRWGVGGVGGAFSSRGTNDLHLRNMRKE